MQGKTANLTAAEAIGPGACSRTCLDAAVFVASPPVGDEDSTLAGTSKAASSSINTKLLKFLLEPIYLSLNTPPGTHGWESHPVAAGAGVVGDPFVGFFWVAVEKRISELSPGLREAGYEMVYFFEKGGALRLCLVKLPLQAGDSFLSI